MSRYRRRRDGGDRVEREKSRRISAKVVVWIVLAVLVLIFIIQNTKSVRVDLLFWNVTTGLG